MATITLKFDGVGFSKFSAVLDGERSALLAAVNNTLTDIGDEILTEGRADIGSAGHFGSRWTEGLQATHDFGPERSTVEIFHTVPYWRIFEFGGTIHGNPLLWIPLSFGAGATRIADYGGALFRVDRKNGSPLLLSRADKTPQYVGKESVTIPQKFHLRDIITNVGGRMAEFFKRNVG